MNNDETVVTTRRLPSRSNRGSMMASLIANAIAEDNVKKQHVRKLATQLNEQSGAMFDQSIADHKKELSEEDRAYEDFWKKQLAGEDDNADNDQNHGGGDSDDDDASGSASAMIDSDDEEFEDEMDDEELERDYMVDEEDEEAEENEAANKGVPNAESDELETERNEQELARLERQEKRRTTQKKNVYVDQKKKGAKASTKASLEPNEGKTPRKRARRESNVAVESPGGGSGSDLEKVTTRASTKERTKMTIEKEEIRRSETKKVKKRVYKEPTQQERLDEAKITSEYNKWSLQWLMQREDMQKKKVIKRKGNEIWLDEGYNKIPRLTYHSVDNHTEIAYSNMDIPTMEYDPKESKYYQKRLQDRIDTGLNEGLCVITGEKAKYKDPKTKLPYATMDAFNQIRQAQEKFELVKKEPNSQHLDFIVYLSTSGIAKFLPAKLLALKKTEQDSKEPKVIVKEQKVVIVKEKKQKEPKQQTVKQPTTPKAPKTPKTKTPNISTQPMVSVFDLQPQPDAKPIPTSVSPPALSPIAVPPMSHAPHPHQMQHPPAPQMPHYMMSHNVVSPPQRQPMPMNGYVQSPGGPSPQQQIIYLTSPMMNNHQFAYGYPMQQGSMQFMPAQSARNSKPGMVMGNLSSPVSASGMSMFLPGVLPQTQNSGMAASPQYPGVYSPVYNPHLQQQLHFGQPQMMPNMQMQSPTNTNPNNNHNPK